jgi:hypothetical protein
VRLVNEGTEPATVERRLSPQFGAVTYEITRRPGEPNADRFKFTPLVHKELADPVTSLAPGKNLEEDAELFFDGRQWVFREPGLYHVEAIYQRRLRSNVLLLRILPPSNEKEALAARLMIENPEAGKFLALHGGDHLTRGMAVLEQVSVDGAGTPHAAHANLVLGLSKLQPFADLSNNRIRPSQPQTALAFLGKVDVGALGVDGATTALLGQAQALRLLNNEGQARELEQKLPDVLKKQFPRLDLPQFQQLRVPDLKKELLR